jgi:prepilin-type N-terminal cleavage/methylation domain-containing protein
MIFKNKKNYIGGFTLIELMTALSIFAIIMTISMGSILGIFNANRKSESLKTVMDNLNFSLETMAREIRFGKNYHCGSSGTLTSPQDCTLGGNFMTFFGLDGRQIIYRYSGTSIQKSVDGGTTYINVTAPEANITGLQFIVVGSEPSTAASNDRNQPRVFLQVKGYAGSKVDTRSSFILQTLVTQRARDI